MKFINDINLKRQAQDLGVKVWQTPGFLFMAMGFVTVAVMTATYLLTKRYDSPTVLVVSESVIVSIILAIGTSIVHFVDEMAQLNKAKSEFVSIASHQLRTPLSAVKWEMELLLKKFKKGLNEKQLKSLENVSSLNQRMIKLVDDLLDVARIDQDRFVLIKKNVDFTRVVKESVDEIVPSVKKRNISLRLDFGKNLPMVYTDPEKIELVVENLINNAVKYTTSGGKIEIKVFRQKDCLVFEIKDNGVGIPEEQTDRVFEKFFRSDNAAKYQTQGTGLGLYIAKNIIEESGGKIWFQSIENVGSVFSFSLPISNKQLC